MKTVKIVDTITEDGLYLKSPELMQFLNQKVEIVVSSFEQKKAERNKRLRKLAGCLSEEDAKIFEEAHAECSQINPEDWK